MRNIIPDFTKDEQDYIKEHANFTGDELRFFELRNKEYSLEYCAEEMNTCISRVKRIDKKVIAKIAKVQLIEALREQIRILKEGAEMIVENTMIVFDGQRYYKGDELPDLGTLVAVSVQGNVRNYEGLSKDRDKLPKYDDLETGSSALFYDTKELYKYEKTNKRWYKMG